MGFYSLSDSSAKTSSQRLLASPGYRQIRKCLFEERADILNRHKTAFRGERDSMFVTLLPQRQHLPLLSEGPSQNGREKGSEDPKFEREFCSITAKKLKNFLFSL